MSSYRGRLGRIAFPILPWFQGIEEEGFGGLAYRHHTEAATTKMLGLPFPRTVEATL